MLSKLKEVLFSEPSGINSALVQFAGAVAMLSIYLYFNVLLDGSGIDTLIMAAGFALSGLAESLPKDRRHIAGGLRITAMLLLIGLIGAIFFPPEVIAGIT